jgi:sensor histidine kinase YesM
MISTGNLISGSKTQRHSLFLVAVLTLLGLGLWLLHAAGFRFKEDGLVAVNCLLFLLYIYAGRWLCWRCYLQGQITRFLVFAVLTFAALAFADFLFVKYAFHHPNAGFIELLYGTAPFFIVGLISGILLKLISHSLQKELQDAQIKAEQKESEFNLLQSQLSPHFLFNVLNNLYGISIGEHQRIPGLLLKLSNLLRYSVYGFKKQFVPLKEELDYIKNYIEFEQIRISDRLILTTHIEQPGDANIKIGPLILIVFIENAFKHAKNSLTQEITVAISLKITGNFICFKVSNSYRAEKNIENELTESSGLGLANTIKRLDLLYANDYELRQNKDDDTYQVELRLKIKD